MTSFTSYVVYVADLRPDDVIDGRKVHTNRGALTIRLATRGWVAREGDSVDAVVGPILDKEEFIAALQDFAWTR